MLPTCIGISGVSRYRNDASIEDSFLPASAMTAPPRKPSTASLRRSGAECAFSGAEYAMGKARGGTQRAPSDAAARCAEAFDEEAKCWPAQAQVSHKLVC